MNRTMNRTMKHSKKYLSEYIDGIQRKITYESTNFLIPVEFKKTAGYVTHARKIKDKQGGNEPRHIEPNRMHKNFFKATAEFLDKTAENMSILSVYNWNRATSGSSSQSLSELSIVGKLFNMYMASLTPLLKNITTFSIESPVCIKETLEKITKKYLPDAKANQKKHDLLIVVFGTMPETISSKYIIVVDFYRHTSSDADSDTSSGTSSDTSSDTSTDASSRGNHSTTIHAIIENIYFDSKTHRNPTHRNPTQLQTGYKQIAYNNYAFVKMPILKPYATLLEEQRRT
jgi:hypothetical protein